jgi:hypothetical protein
MMITSHYMRRGIHLLIFFDCVRLYYEGKVEVNVLSKDDCDSDEE